MSQPSQGPSGESARAKHLNNYRIFRPQAVEAYSTRQTGEPWCGHLRFESWIIACLSVMAMAAAAIIFLRGH
jgi:hypothetical protein